MRTPQAIFVIFAILVGIAAYLNGNSTIDLPFFDYYLEIKREHIALALVLPFLLISLIYFMFRRIQMVWWMTLVHIIFTAVPLFIIPFINRVPLSQIFSVVTLVFTCIFIVGQIIFWLNLAISYSRRNK